MLICSGSHVNFVLFCSLSLSGLSDPGNHLPAGEHPGHHGHSEEQEPPLAHVLLCLQVSSLIPNPKPRLKYLNLLHM